jgi:hypothetical protein
MSDDWSSVKKPKNNRKKNVWNSNLGVKKGKDGNSPSYSNPQKGQEVSLQGNLGNVSDREKLRRCRQFNEPFDIFLLSCIKSIPRQLFSLHTDHDNRITVVDENAENVKEKASDKKPIEMELDKYKGTPYYISLILCTIFFALKTDVIEAVKIGIDYLKRNTDITKEEMFRARYTGAYTLVHYAAYNMAVECLREFINMGADLFNCSPSGENLEDAPQKFVDAMVKAGKLPENVKRNSPQQRKANMCRKMIIERKKFITEQNEKYNIS